MTERHIITNLSLDFLSGVDRPAQAPALALLIKSVPPPSSNAITPQRTDQEPLVTTTPDDLAKSQARVTQLEGDVASFKKANDRLTCLLALTPLEKQYFLKQAEVDQEVYIRQGVAACSARAADLIKQDPVIYKDLEGNEYRQSDDQRMVSTAKRADENQKEVALQKSQLAAQTVEKRAVDLFKSMAGSGSTKGAVLRAVEGIPDEAVRKEALEMLAKADTAAEYMLEQHAIGGEPEIEEGSALDKLDKLAKNLQAKDPTQFGDYHDAYAHVVANTHEGQELYAEYSNGG